MRGPAFSSPLTTTATPDLHVDRDDTAPLRRRDVRPGHPRVSRWIEIAIAKDQSGEQVVGRPFIERQGSVAREAYHLPCQGRGAQDARISSYRRNAKRSGLESLVANRGRCTFGELLDSAVVDPGLFDGMMMSIVE
jgi:hypothetical protein